MVLGVDGCKNGWIAISLDESGRLDGALTALSLEKVFEGVPEVAVAGVDMPLHLLDAPTRPADLLARKALGPNRGRSVFPALPHFVITEEWPAEDFETINRECRARYDRAFSRQSLALRAKIAEVNTAFRAGHPVIEVHPELSFAAMNGGKALEFSKKSWGGLEERLALLNSVGITLDQGLPDDVRRLAPDDLVDAAAAAWSAFRYRKGTARSLPNNPGSTVTPRIWS
ncbi:MAG: DUF429 domain-containing protein [Akkermansiaceae bacterium]|nr:DUF429 domain-containing protein [Akkermansiaceae bacterium]